MSDAPLPVAGAEPSVDKTVLSTSPAADAAENDSAEKDHGNVGDAQQATGTGTPAESADGTMSKSRMKKLKRQQQWEEGRDDRKRRRKEKRLAKQAQRRAEKAERGGQEGEGEGGDAPKSKAATVAPPKEKSLVPVSLIFDCDFEQYMRETELISLASQITRSYAANRTAARSTRIYVSSWGGKLRTRYETLLASQHLRWKDVYFVEDNFVAAAQQADAAMRGDGSGAVVDVLGTADGDKQEETAKETAQETDEPQPQVVYLSSDSPNTLTRLEPYTSYVIGGLVDKNREKGLCYARAQARGIRTAKLPIGDYMVMASRQVLTTNHVVEIMLRWLETGDWAVAFEQVIPKRKGGHLREDKKGGSEKGEGEEKEKDEDAGEGEGEGEEAEGSTTDEKPKDETTSTVDSTVDTEPRQTT